MKVWRHWKERAIQNVNSVLNDLRLSCLGQRSYFENEISGENNVVVDPALEPVGLSFLIRYTNKVVDGYMIVF